MPLYEYKCQSCQTRLEVIQRFSDAPKKRCPECGGRLEKLISRSGFVLKGGGWYANDYSSAPAPKAGKTGETSEAGDSGSDKAAGKEAAAPASKPAEKPADKPSKKKTPAGNPG